LSQRLLAAMTLMMLGGAWVQAAPLIIDNFQTNHPILFAGPGGGNPISSNSGVPGGAPGDILGDARNLKVTRTTGSSLGTAYVSGGELTVGMITDLGYSRIIWDGDLNSSLNYALAVDLTGGGLRDRFHVRARSDLSGSVHLTVFTSATSYSSVTFSLPALGIAAPYSDYNLLFTSLTMGAPALVAADLGLGAATAMADLTNITAITLFVDGTAIAGLDAQFQIVEVASGVPEPATLGLVGGVLLGVSLLRRRVK